MSPVVLGAILGVLVMARVVIWAAPVTVPNEKQRGVIREYLDAFIVAGAVALLLMHFIVRTFWIPSGSMEPTLEVNDVLLANEIQYRFEDPQVGQIAVFSPPSVLGKTDFIKRVIAGPGDRIRIHDGVVYRNGVALKEPYVKEPANYELEVKNYDLVVDGIPLSSDRAVIPPKPAWQAPNRLPKGYYLMLGDNRTNSDDGHLWGLLPRDQFVGHAFLVFWPPNRIHLLN